MPAPIIQKTGSSSGVGGAGEGSNDLVPGETLTIADLEGANGSATYFWELEAVPRGVTPPAITGATTSTPSFVVDVDPLKTGSYRLKGTVDGAFSSSEVYGVPLPNSGGRIASQREKLEYDEGGNTDGWHGAEVDFKRAVDAKLGPAKTTVSGLTKLSVAPASAASPIAVGDNDSRNSDSRTPTSHSHTEADISDLSHLDTTAIHKATSGEINALTVKALPVAGDVLMIEDSENFFIKKKTPLANLLGGGSSAGGVESNLWSPPTVAHADDVEFDSAVQPTGWAWATSSGIAAPAGVIDPYDAFTGAAGTVPRVDFHDQRKSWLMMQCPGNNDNHFFFKPKTFPTNFFAWARLSFNSRNNLSPVNNDYGVGLAFCADDGAGVPDFSQDSVNIFLNETDGGIARARILVFEGGATALNAGTPDIWTTGMLGQHFEYVAIQKIGAGIHFWVSGSNGSWVYVGFITYTGAVFAHVALVLVNASTSDPGTCISGADFIRFKDSATFLP